MFERTEQPPGRPKGALGSEKVGVDPRKGDMQLEHESSLWLSSINHRSKPRKPLRWYRNKRSKRRSVIKTSRPFDNVSEEKEDAGVVEVTGAVMRLRERLENQDLHLLGAGAHDEDQIIAFHRTGVKWTLTYPTDHPEGDHLNDARRPHFEDHSLARCHDPGHLCPIGLGTTVSYRADAATVRAGLLARHTEGLGRIESVGI